MKKGTVESWGRQVAAANVLQLEELGHDQVNLARGLGRAYGDAALPARDDDVVLDTTLADRITDFDRNTGRLRAQAGLSIEALNETLLLQGFFVPVSPGTQYVTLGGAVAADIHGKNHHIAGTFGRHVSELVMETGRGEVTCSRDEHAGLFSATTGGMGLTGVIKEVELTMEKIPSPWIVETAYKVTDIEHFLSEMTSAAQTWPFTVGWIDCLAKGKSLGRGILMVGRWAQQDEVPSRRKLSFGQKIAMPFSAPSWALKNWSVRLFNEGFYRLRKLGSERITSPYSFFYPLDAVGHWNRMYGKRGLTQYQCAVPRSAGVRPIIELLEKVSMTGLASFLCVIKDFGEQGDGLISFPMEGTTLAIDLPNDPQAADIVADLNRTLRDAGGRIYLAKDLHTSRNDFQAMEGERLRSFQAVRDEYQAIGRYRSALSERLID